MSGLHKLPAHGCRCAVANKYIYIYCSISIMLFFLLFKNGLEGLWKSVSTHRTAKLYSGNRALLRRHNHPQTFTWKKFRQLVLNAKRACHGLLSAGVKKRLAQELEPTSHVTFQQKEGFVQTCQTESHLEVERKPSLTTVPQKAVA